MPISPDGYRMTRQEIDELRQDTKDALKSPEYLSLLKQITPLDLSKETELQNIFQTEK